MTLWTILAYQIGHADSIRSVARNRFSIGVGAVLVLTAAIARNGDQRFILEDPLWPAGPLVISLIASFLIYGVAHPLLYWRDKDGEKPRFWRQYPIFLGLFWMTAPVAWLYALPAERLFETNTAAIVNVSLLGIVSIWRVSLLTRALAVLTGCPWSSVLPRILLPASALMWLASVSTSLSIVGIMGGMLQSPEEAVLLQASELTFWGSIVCFITSGLLSVLIRVSRAKSLITRQQTVQLPLASLSGLLVLFVTFAIWPQIELAKNYRVQTLMTDGKYREALDYLGAIDSSDLSPTRPVFPNPYENEVFAHLHGVFGALTERDPEWIRRLYLDHLTVRVHHSSRLGEPTEFVTIFESLERLPGGQAWIDDNRDTVRQTAQYTLGYEMADSDRSRLTASLGNLGIHIDEDWR